MYAIVKTGGKQYRVTEGDSIRVENLHAEVGSTVELDQVLLTGEGEKVSIGTPFVSGAKIKARVMFTGREKKITVIKFQRRKDSRLKQGHRQYYTELKIENILTQNSKTESVKNEKADKKSEALDQPKKVDKSV